MLSATYFTYDNIHSGTYGLQIASFNDNVVEETSYLTPSIITAKSNKSHKNHFIDLKYDNAPTFEFQIVSSEPIHEVVQREILTWLEGRRGYRELRFHQYGLDEYAYNCIFTVTNLIYHANSCVGFTVSATFDSQYHYANPTVAKITGAGTETTVVLYNLSDKVDEYTYPTVEFTVTGGTTFKVTNITDNPTREFNFTGLSAAASIAKDANQKPMYDVVVDNENKIITTNSAGANQASLQKFNKKWLRLVKGKNELKITFTGECVITCPQYAKIRF